MQQLTQTREAERAAKRILSRWLASSRHLADVPSIARIIDSETNRPELIRLHMRYEKLLAAFIELLAFAESKCDSVDESGHTIEHSQIEKAHSVLDDICDTP